MSGAAIIVKQNSLMRKFRAAGATGPTTAVAPEEIGCRQGRTFRRMAARGVFVSVGDGKFYVDEEAAQEFVRRRRKRVLVGLAVMLVLLIVVVIAVNH